MPGINQATASIYQQGQDFAKTTDNIRRLVQLRKESKMDTPVLIWKYLIFNWNDKSTYLQQAIEMAEEIGFDKIKFVVCVSPFYGISLKTMVNPPKVLTTNAKQGLRNHQTVIKHREYDITFS